MSKTSMVLRRIAGSVVGLLAGGGLAFLVVVIPFAGADNEDVTSYVPLFLGIPGFLVGGTIGSAMGAAVMRDDVGRRGSFWSAVACAAVALVAASFTIWKLCWALYRQGTWTNSEGLLYVGLAVVGAATTAGAVIGSGWKAKSTDGASSEGLCQKCGCHLRPDAKTCVVCGNDVK
jgi:hypothetical protein